MAADSTPACDQTPSVADARDAVIAAARAFVLTGPSGDRDNPTDVFKLAADLSRAVRTLVDAEETWGTAEQERLATDAWAEVRRLRAALRELERERDELREKYARQESQIALRRGDVVRVKGSALVEIRHRLGDVLDVNGGEVLVNVATATGLQRYWLFVEQVEAVTRDKGASKPPPPEEAFVLRDRVSGEVRGTLVIEYGDEPMVSNSEDSKANNR
jgi:hypothetical protein